VRIEACGSYFSAHEIAPGSQGNCSFGEKRLWLAHLGPYRTDFELRGLWF